MQEQHAFGEESWSLPLNGLTKFPDFHLFGPLKHHLSAEHFPDDEAVVYITVLHMVQTLFLIGTEILNSTLITNEARFTSTGT
jgi:hypothetical protein